MVFIGGKVEATFQVAPNRLYYSIRNDTRASGILRQPVYYKQTGCVSMYSIPDVTSIPVTSYLCDNWYTIIRLLYQFIQSIPVAAYTSYHLYQLPLIPVAAYTSYHLYQLPFFFCKNLAETDVFQK
jgi:hypothetical protein